jgi:hypothetical protein
VELPDASLVWKAISIYLERAYPGLTPPPSVQRRLEAVRSSGEGLYDSPVLEHDPARRPARWALRLGNSAYPHMKLQVETRSDGRGFFFRADTHDCHLFPARDEAEAALVGQLRERNGSVSRDIEDAWEAAGIPTFRSFLREDLARRAETVLAPEEDPAGG